MSYMTTAQQKLFFSDTGGEQPALVFSHGFFLNSSMFQPQVEALKSSYRCICWDQRGFGRTEAKGNFSYWDSARDAFDLLDHLDIENATFIGMSQGGFLSMRAALLRPDRVNALILIATESGTFTTQEKSDYRAVFDHFISNDKLGDIGREVSRLVIGDPLSADQWLARWEETDWSNLHFAAKTLLERDDISNSLGEIQCPSLLIHGTGDQAIDIEKAKALNQALPNSYGLFQVSGAAHAPNITHPELVNEAIIEFLVKIRKG